MAGSIERRESFTSQSNLPCRLRLKANYFPSHQAANQLPIVLSLGRRTKRHKLRRREPHEVWNNKRRYFLRDNSVADCTSVSHHLGAELRYRRASSSPFRPTAKATDSARSGVPRRSRTGRLLARLFPWEAGCIGLGVLPLPDVVY